MSEAAQTNILQPGQSSASTTGSRTPLKVKIPKVLSVSNLYKSYHKGRLHVPVLKGVDVQIHEGEFTAIVGQSGSGKSTLLHLLGTLDAPDKGEIWFQDRRIDNLPARQQERIRNRKFGMIFQFYHLLPELTTIENVLVPRMVQDNFLSYMRNKKKIFNAGRGATRYGWPGPPIKPPA